MPPLDMGCEQHQLSQPVVWGVIIPASEVSSCCGWVHVTPHCALDTEIPVMEQGQGETWGHGEGVERKMEM